MAGFTDVLALDWGDTDYLDFFATQPDGTVQDLTNWTVEFTVKRSLADPDGSALIHKTTATGGVVVTNATGGLGTVPLAPADYAAVPNEAGRYFAELVGKDPFGGVNRLKKVTLAISPVATEAP